MPQMPKPRSPANARRAPGAAIPKFRELKLSAVVAACAFQRKPVTERASNTLKLVKRFDRD
jgi:hypothetical protein